MTNPASDCGAVGPMSESWILFPILPRQVPQKGYLSPSNYFLEACERMERKGQRHLLNTMGRWVNRWGMILDCVHETVG